MSLSSSKAISSSRNVQNQSAIYSSSTRITELTQPHPDSFSVAVPFSGNILHYLRHFIGYHKVLPNLVSTSCWLNDESRHFFFYKLNQSLSHTNLYNLRSDRCYTTPHICLRAHTYNPSVERPCNTILHACCYVYNRPVYWIEFGPHVDEWATGMRQSKGEAF